MSDILETSKKLEDLIQKKLEQLIRSLADPLARKTTSTDRFATILYQNGSLSLEEKEDCLTRQTSYKKNEAIYELVGSKGTGEKLKEALEGSENFHVIKLIQEKLLAWTEKDEQRGSLTRSRGGNSMTLPQNQNEWVIQELALDTGNEMDQNDSEQLCRLLNRNELALRHAVIFMKIQNCSIKSYIEKYEQNSRKLCTGKSKGPSIPIPLYLVLRVSMEKATGTKSGSKLIWAKIKSFFSTLKNTKAVKVANEWARAVLNILTFLQPDKISEKFVASFFPASCKENVHDGLTRLIDYGLITTVPAVQKSEQNDDVDASARFVTVQELVQEVRMGHLKEEKEDTNVLLFVTTRLSDSIEKLAPQDDSNHETFSQTMHVARKFKSVYGDQDIGGEGIQKFFLFVEKNETIWSQILAPTNVDIAAEEEEPFETTDEDTTSGNNSNHSQLDDVGVELRNEKVLNFSIAKAAAILSLSLVAILIQFCRGKL